MRDYYSSAVHSVPMVNNTVFTLKNLLRVDLMLNVHNTITKCMKIQDQVKDPKIQRSKDPSHFVITFADHAPSVVTGKCSRPEPCVLRLL